MDDGQRLMITNIRRNSVESTDPGIKSGNYLNNVLALNQANKNGFDDCIMLNGNIYFVNGDITYRNIKPMDT